jgi:hypothetical protein
MPGIRDKARSLTGVKARTAIRGKKITWAGSPFIPGATIEKSKRAHRSQMGTFSWPL